MMSPVEVTHRGRLTENQLMSEIDLIVSQIQATRRYTEGLLETIDAAAWFWMPPGGATHVAWQVGHLAYAEYRLTLERIRGEAQGDAELIPEAFRQRFQRESVPDPDPAHAPTPAELRDVFDRVHRQALTELARLADADLDVLLPSPHPLARNRREILLWCGQHEMLHAGQIGLLRRLLGQAPRW
jgi:uncharacterized damage-inducible protein DinB